MADPRDRLILALADKLATVAEHLSVLAERKAVRKAAGPAAEGVPRMTP